MANDMPIPNGVVLDAPKARAILYTAVQEGLIDGDPGIGDGFVRDLLAHPPAPALVEKAMEQLVIGGRVLLPPSRGVVLQPSWQGELFDSGILVPLPYLAAGDLVEVPEISYEIILGLASVRGGNWSEEKLSACIDTLNHANQQWEATKGDLTYGSIDLLKVFERSGWKDFETGMTPEQDATWESLNAAIVALGPIIESVNEYKALLTHALSKDALSSLPVLPARHHHFSLGKIEDTTDWQVMLKISCDKLPRAPVGRTLRETASLAVTPAGEAYRAKMAKWVALLRKNADQGYESALADIESARRELSFSKKLATAGEYATWVGAGTFVAGMVFPPIAAVAAIGGAATVVGVLSLGADKTIKYRNRWAMFSA
jgi:hypothetical protein